MLSVFPTFAVGGAQVRFVRLAAAFGSAWRHAVIAMDGVRECAERLPRDLAVTFPEVSVAKGDVIGNVRRFRALLRALQPDLLVTHNWGSIEWAMANLLPVARHVHIEDGFGPEERARQLPRRVWTRRVVLRRATVVLPSRTLERLARKVWRLPGERVLYLPNGIDLARFTPRAPSPLPAEPVIGTVAVLRAEKNLGRLLRAVAIARARRPVRLEIVGDGPERAELERLAGELGIAEAVTFHGRQAHPAPFYARFDLVALSSDTEQMPMCVLEGMASGLPVVSTDVGDVRAMVAAENAALIVPKDEAALAEAILRVLDDDALRRRISTANRAKAEAEFDERVMIERYRRLFAGEIGHW
ncbi:glycosyltransferase family 4 protein [Elioraea thermophila]|uniref:glycosyltransferase family 4 protein n=1 Tax=Elioraea thermophila TaxID=2185104 RepID=UPI0018E57B98|nr:glycosyltransferase family 4 protein [Elioraea thermophila]